MSANKKSTARDWADPDDAPNLSAPAWRERIAGVRVKRGRPKSPVTKVSTTIRLDAGVLEALKSGGAGWQTRANGILRAKLLAKGKPAKHV